MIRFYDIDQDYVNYLKTIDRQIPNIHYSSNNKFVCGIVLDINDVQFYAPISHNTQKFQTSMIIYDGMKPMSSIRFSFMLPATENVLTVKDFKEIAKIDQHYADVLAAEYKFCVRYEDAIRKKALAVYNIGCNKNHRLNFTCCDFKKLEEKYLLYKKEDVKLDYKEQDTSE